MFRVDETGLYKKNIFSTLSTRSNIFSEEVSLLDRLRYESRTQFVDP